MVSWEAAEEEMPPGEFQLPEAKPAPPRPVTRYCRTEARGEGLVPNWTMSLLSARSRLASGKIAIDVVTRGLLLPGEGGGGEVSASEREPREAEPEVKLKAALEEREVEAEEREPPVRL